MIGEIILLGLVGIVGFIIYFGSLIASIVLWKDDRGEAITLLVLFFLLSIVLIGGILMLLHI